MLSGFRNGLIRWELIWSLVGIEWRGKGPMGVLAGLARLETKPTLVLS